MNYISHIMKVSVRLIFIEVIQILLYPSRKTEEIDQQGLKFQ